MVVVCCFAAIVFDALRTEFCVLLSRRSDALQVVSLLLMSCHGGHHGARNRFGGSWKDPNIKIYTLLYKTYKDVKM